MGVVRDPHRRCIYFFISDFSPFSQSRLLNQCLTIDIIDYVTGIGNYCPPMDNVCNDCAFKRKTCWLHVYDGPRSYIVCSE